MNSKYVNTPTPSVSARPIEAVRPALLKPYCRQLLDQQIGVAEIASLITALKSSEQMVRWTEECVLTPTVLTVLQSAKKPVPVAEALARRIRLHNWAVAGWTAAKIGGARFLRGAGNVLTSSARRQRGKTRLITYGAGYVATGAAWLLDWYSLDDVMSLQSTVVDFIMAQIWTESDD